MTRSGPALSVTLLFMAAAAMVFVVVAPLAELPLSPHLSWLPMLVIFAAAGAVSFDVPGTGTSSQSVGAPMVIASLFASPAMAMALAPATGLAFGVMIVFGRSSSGATDLGRTLRRIIRMVSANIVLQGIFIAVAHATFDRSQPFGLALAIAMVTAVAVGIGVNDLAVDFAGRLDGYGKDTTSGILADVGFETVSASLGFVAACLLSTQPQVLPVLLAPMLLGQLAQVVHPFVARQAERHARLEAKVREDALTGLANRLAFAEAAGRALARQRRTDARLAIFFFDVDGFKTLNDTYGHAFGDRALCVTAERIALCIRDHDVAARLAGDEFAAIVEDLADGAAILDLGTRFLRAVSAPIESVNGTVHFGVSIGAALAEPSEKLSADELLNRADAAMYRAKRAGKGQFVIWSSETNTVPVARDMRSPIADPASLTTRAAGPIM